MMEKNNSYSPGRLFQIYERPQIPHEIFEERLWSNAGKEILEYLLNERKLARKTIKYFKLGATENNEVAIPIFKDGNLIDYKFRSVKEKRFRRVEDAETWVINDDAFLKAEENGFVVITEGEFDTMAVWQMGIKSVVSGTGGAQSLALWIDRIPEKAKVYINYDNDEPGQDSARKLAERIGIERCYNVILPTKDANDFIKEGHTYEEYIETLKSSKRFEVKDVYKLADALEALEKNKIQRVSTFLDRINIHTKGGIPRKSLIIVSGITGIGKSTTVMNFLIDHADKGLPVMLISLENDIYFTLQRLLEIKYNRPIGSFTPEDLQKIKKELVHYPFYIDMSMDSYSMEKITNIVRQAKKLYGVEFLGFDHIGWLPNRKYNVTQEVSQMTRDFKMMARENDIIVYLVSHIRKLDSGQIYITGEDLKDSSSLQQDADMVFFVVDTKNGKELVIDKARMSESHLRIPLDFNNETGKISDDMNRKVKRFDEEVVVKSEEKTSGLVDMNKIET